MIFDIGKTLAQLLATAGIAWFTVAAALRRFKAEKTWERRFDAYSRAVTALGNMQAVLNQWMRDLELRVERPDYSIQATSARYQAAKVELDQCIAVARLILPDDTFQTLSKVRSGLDGIDPSDEYGTYDIHASLVANGLQQLVEQGRVALR
jgi:hypothetical protein